MGAFERDENGLKYVYGLVLCLLGALILLLPAVLPHLDPRLGQAIDRGLLLAVIVSAAKLVGGRRLFVVLGVQTLIVVGLGIWSFDSASTVIQAGYALGNLTLFSVLGGGIVAQVLKTPKVRLDTVMGALTAYLLFGIAFAELHLAISIMSVGAYSGIGEAGASGGFIYYSFVTLTTLGYGDILPILPSARSAAIFEATFGQAYVAVIVARFVALEVAHSARPTEGSGEE